MTKLYKLPRSIKTYELILFGIGAMLGSSIYTLIGKIAVIAGVFSPISFLIAAIIALFSGLSYAELSARIPKSAGEAFFLNEAFHNKFFSYIAGILVIICGITSAALMISASSSYIEALFHDKYKIYIIIAMMLLLLLIASLSTRFSMMTVMLITILTVIGMLIVSIVGYSSHTHFSFNLVGLSTNNLNSIISASYLAFFAFVAFENIINMADDTINATRSLPRALLVSLLITTILYIVVDIAVLLAVPLERLQASEAPLLSVMDNVKYGYSFIAFVSIIALANSALTQILMTTRVIHAMSYNRMLPKFLGLISHKTKTPLYAAFFTMLIIFLVTILMSIDKLASVAVFCILSLFTLVNISLIRIKEKPAHKGYTGYKVPRIIPYIGATMSIFMILHNLVH